MTDRWAKLRKQKRCHCNSVSFSLSGSLWLSSDVQFGFFNQDFINFIQKILFGHLSSLVAICLSLRHTHIYILYMIFVETKGKEGRLFNFVEDHRKGQGIL